MGDFTNQVHDFEPGIAPSGLFWTVPIDNSQMSAAPGAGRARFTVANMAVPDYHDFFSSISPSPTSIPSTVSFDVKWAGGGTRQKIHDATYGFEGDFVDGPATIDFTAQQDGSSVVYRSNPEGQITVSAAVGHERNGVFFH